MPVYELYYFSNSIFLILGLVALRYLLCFNSELILANAVIV